MDEFFPIIDENINPCRGCPDYDEDGCKSNGGCGYARKEKSMPKEDYPKLRNCPFCGGEAIIDDCGDHRYFVRCSKCSINQDKLFAQKCDAARAWNRRANNG